MLLAHEPSDTTAADESTATAYGVYGVKERRAIGRSTLFTCGARTPDIIDSDCVLVSAGRSPTRARVGWTCSVCGLCSRGAPAFAETDPSFAILDSCFAGSAFDRKMGGPLDRGRAGSRDGGRLDPGVRDRERVGDV